MDFDKSKENIQPLRGGRNVSQLEIALQAQHNPEFQQQLELEKAEYENKIKNYSGPDPLDPYFQFILWIEQTYPKHGQEGNFSNVLRVCLERFEHDERYSNDQRFCKLWIKYIDMQGNPIELYKMLYSRRKFVGCADLYKAWALYYEVIGDFKNADEVFQTGMKECAQPFEELQNAHKNMIFAIGLQAIRGVDHKRLEDERIALVTLKQYRPGRVANVRTPASSSGGYASCSQSTQRPNVPIQIYQSQDDVSIGAVAGPVNILDAVKRDQIKENFMKAGTWSSGYKREKPGLHKPAGFTIHDENAEVSPEITGLQVPENFCKQTLEDLSTFVIPIRAETIDEPNKLPMYCKREVYMDPSTEYSMEEVRSRKYLRKNRLSVPYMETEQAIQSITDQNDHSFHGVSYNTTVHHNSPGHSKSGQQSSFHSMDRSQQFHQSQPHSSQSFFSSMPQPHTQIHTHFPQSEEHMQMQNLSYMHPQQQFASQIKQPSISPQKSQNSTTAHAMSEEVHMQTAQFGNEATSPFQNFPSGASFRLPLQVQSPHRFQQLPYGSPLKASHSPLLPNPHQGKSVLQTKELEVNGAPNLLMEDLWNNGDVQSADKDNSIHIPKRHISKIVPFEDSSVFQKNHTYPTKGNAMKTPIKVLSDEDLAETGSRGGMDTAATAQPTDGAKRLAMYNDDDYINSTNTEIFFINAVHVSTPQKLSIIEEESSTVSNNSSRGRINHLRRLDEEQYNFNKSGSLKKVSSNADRYQSNLEANSRVNAELRSTLFGNLMESSDTPTAISPVRNVAEVFEIDEGSDDEEECEEVEYVPYEVIPLAPSDPFKEPVLKKLLQHVGFPGRHKQGFIQVLTIPKIGQKKDLWTIANHKYVVDNVLGKGTYGSVYKAQSLQTGKMVALKFQKPANKWEFYICRELQCRLANHDLKYKLMDIHIGYYSETASVLLSNFSPYGSLLQAANSLKVKLGKMMKQNLCIYFTIEMLNIVQTLHEAKIIHADIKPDNFLVTIDNNILGLQLIDFGCSIDMSLFPEGTMFTRKIRTSGFVCCEMLDQRPWNYHTDLFCIAATTHVLLFDKYMQLQKKDDRWFITQKLSRYHSADLWNTFFNSFLNMQDGLPDIDSLKEFMQGFIKQTELVHETRDLINTLKNR